MTIFAIRTTANREDQVLDFVSSNAKKKSLKVYSIVHPHGMRGYIFIEAESKQDAENASQGVPYAKGILPAPVKYTEIEHMLEQAQIQVNIKKNDIVEIISGPFKKEKVIIELLESAVPIPMTLKLDSIKVIRREEEEK